MKRKVSSVFMSICLSLGLIVLLCFQNCGKVGFKDDYNSIYSQSGASMVIENGAVATNKKTLAIHFGGSTDVFTSMRIARVQDMDSANIPWQDYKSDVTFDLGADWASDGTKDEIKSIYAELRVLQDPALPLRGQIGLDTVAPKISGQGILATGIQGQAFTKGQAVPLSYQYSDPVSPLGYASDIDPRGFKWGYSLTPDCSVGVTFVSDWGTPQPSVNLPWPAATPLDTFYVCGLIRDLAGNTSTTLSQPMTSLWRVYAGSNNQGNGGSVTAEETRFKYPISLGADSQASIYVSDSQFASVRKINSSSLDKGRIISLWAGNGHLASSVNGNAANSPINGSHSIVFDSQDQAYIGVPGGVFRSSMDANGVVTQTQVISLCGGRTNLLMHTHNGVESLIVNASCDSLLESSTTTAYLFDVPLSALAGLTAPLSTATLISKYVLAGNATLTPSTFVIPTPHTMIAKDSDDSNSVGLVLGMALGPNGEIYYSTGPEGSGRPIGQHSIRRLTYQADGSIVQDVLTTSLGWPQSLAYAPATAKHPASLIVGSNNGFYILDLTPPTKSKYYSFAASPLTVAGEITWGVLALVPSGQTQSEFYVAVSARSRILHLDQDFNVLETLGRPVYNSSEPTAVTAMIGQPEGMTQDPMGNLYFFDSVSHVVRTIASTGDRAITLVAGTPGVPLSQNYAAPGTKLTDAKFSGLSRFNSNFSYPVSGQFSTDGSVAKLYLGEGVSARVHELDLNSGLVQTISGNFATSAAKSATPLGFGVWGMALANLGGTPNLFISRNCYTYTCGTTGDQYTGLITQMPLTSPASTETTVLGSLASTATFYANTSVYNATGTSPLAFPVMNDTTIKTDSTGNLYTSAYGFYVMPMSAGKLGNIVNLAITGNSRRASINQFEVIEQGTGRVVIYVSGESLYATTLTADQISGKDTTTPLTPKKLCLPGTFFKQVTSTLTGKDQSLFLADAANGRVMQYFLRDSAGNLDLSYCP